MEKRFIEVPRTGRYYLIGNLTQPKSVWVCLHGYGQQSKYFAPKVKALDNGENLIVVAEALNRFYLSGYNGRVGATWMTSDDRELDISDNDRYLEHLVSGVYKEFNLGDIKLNLLAFSQGIATGCRWIAHSKLQFNQAILWAGSIPPDLDWEKETDRFNRIKIQYVFGDQDQFFDNEKIESNRQLFALAGIEHQLVTFEGKHEIDDNVLMNLLQ
ncbi:MAG: phospholipase [Crocinitomicaceae bacterium]|nr:phospholipase [Crocinitomicaceae bacterium]|tara:strand:+ start:11856 stop:12497 length:642 start_codon:yes stop_codon:yes gene_type:complete